MSIALLSTVAIACVEAAFLQTAPAADTPGIASAVQEEAAPNTLPAPATNDAAAENGAGEIIAPSQEALPELVFSDLSDDEVVERVLMHIKGLSTLRADFTQIAPSGGVARGALHLRRPNQLRFEYEPPSPLLIVATQGNVYVRDNELETTDFYPIRKTPLRFLLSRKIDLDDAQVVAVDRGVDTVAVTFASDDEETEGELSIILRAPELALAQWAVRDLQNGVTIVTLDNVVKGEKFKNSLFRAPDAGGEFLKN